MAANHHRLIITGTGRTGTTFLVQLLSALGLDTGYRPGEKTPDYFAHCHAGLEQKQIEEPDAPYVVKDPDLCDTLSGILARGQVVIDHAIVPIRNLQAAARSRERVGGAGEIPGGLLGTPDPDRQPAVLAERFHRLMETLVAYDIPHTLLLFPRFVCDVEYAYAKLGGLLPGVSREQFVRAFRATVRPELIHDFSNGLPADRGDPAGQFTRELQQRRRQRRRRRVLAAATIATALLLALTLQSSALLAVLADWFSLGATSGGHP